MASPPARRGTSRTRTTVVTEQTGVTMIVPKGRTAAERRLAAVAALHAPLERHHPGSSAGGVILEPPQTYYVCGECKVPDRSYGVQPARWPCATARLLGPWPGEPE